MMTKVLGQNLRPMQLKEVGFGILATQHTHCIVKLEQQTLQFFSTKSHHVHEEQNDVTISALMCDSDILFNNNYYYCFEKIVWLYVTVQGFNLLTSWLGNVYTNKLYTKNETAEEGPT